MQKQGLLSAAAGYRKFNSAEAASPYLLFDDFTGSVGDFTSTRTPTPDGVGAYESGTSARLMGDGYCFKGTAAWYTLAIPCDGDTLGVDCEFILNHRFTGGSIANNPAVYFEVRRNGTKYIRIQYRTDFQCWFFSAYDGSSWTEYDVVFGASPMTSLNTDYTVRVTDDPTGNIKLWLNGTLELNRTLSTTTWPQGTKNTLAGLAKDYSGTLRGYHTSQIAQTNLAV